jgi:hypothetical protein
LLTLLPSSAITSDKLQGSLSHDQLLHFAELAAEEASWDAKRRALHVGRSAPILAR